VTGIKRPKPGISRAANINIANIKTKMGMIIFLKELIIDLMEVALSRIRARNREIDSDVLCAEGAKV